MEEDKASRKCLALLLDLMMSGHVVLRTLAFLQDR